MLNADESASVLRFGDSDRFVGYCDSGNKDRKTRHRVIARHDGHFYIHSLRDGLPIRVIGRVSY